MKPAERFFPKGLFQRALELQDWCTETRRHLHRHPERSGQEFETLAYLRGLLDEFGAPWIEVEDGGILALLGDERRGKTVLLRADIDALPISENPRNLKRAREVISENPGTQHACGHDAHTAMLLATAKLLAPFNDEIPGRIILLFQRGEEGNGNLREILKYVDAKHIHIDGAHAIHVRPDLPAGKIASVAGAVMASPAAFDITITGSGGHGSRPDLANNPLDCWAALYQGFKDIRLKHTSPFEPFTLVVGKLDYGAQANVISPALHFVLSVRFYNEDCGEIFHDEVLLLLEGITKAYHCAYTVNRFLVALPPIKNDAAAAAISQNAIRSYIGEEHLISAHEPMMCSDDFALIGKRYPAVMLQLGIRNEGKGSGAELHSDLFDIDEAALPFGIAATAGFALDFLASADE